MQVEIWSDIACPWCFIGKRRFETALDLVHRQRSHAHVVAAALQLRKGFRQTLMYSILFSFVDILSGLFLSYYIDAAPGGVTALTAVALLVLVIIYKEGLMSVKERRRRHE